MSNDPLTILADKYGSDKGNKEHLYTTVYNSLFEPIRDQVTRVFEIGVNFGESAYMWQDYFPNASIHMADIFSTEHYHSDRASIVKNKLKERGINFWVIDQGDRDAIQIVEESKLSFDFVLDDGSHYAYDQQVSLGFFFKLVKPGGLYIIEDLKYKHFRKGGRFLKTMTRTSDMLNLFIEHGQMISPAMMWHEILYLNTQIESISFESDDNIAIIRKKTV